MIENPEYSFLGKGCQDHTNGRESVDLCNETLKWYNTDSVDTYRKNLKDKISKEHLKNNGWLDKDISYSFNEKGFRSDSFINSRCEILFNGTSTSMGVGIDCDSTFSKLFADHHGTGHYNIAVPGSDWQTVAQRSAYWITRLKPKVLIIKSVKHRFNWWKQENDWYLMRSTAQFTSKEMMECRISSGNAYVDMPIIDQIGTVNSNWYEYSMIKFHEKICEENNCQLIVINEKDNVTDGDLARDLIHYGKIYHAKVFDWLKTQKLNYKS